MARRAWSYRAGEKGRNRVRVYCQGCPRSCVRASAHPGGLYLEWYEGTDRHRELLRVAPGGPAVRDTAAAKARADKLAAKYADLAAKNGAGKAGPPLTVQRLFMNYNREVTPTKGRSKQQHDRRARRVWTAFFDAQPEPNRRSTRPVSTLDRIDWDRFAHWRRAGKTPGFAAVRGRQVEYDVKYMLAALNWAVGNRSIAHNPWCAEVRRTQCWEMPKELSPHRPAMTDMLRERLIQHQPSWQMGLALRVG